MYTQPIQFHFVSAVAVVVSQQSFTSLAEQAHSTSDERGRPAAISARGEDDSETVGMREEVAATAGGREAAVGDERLLAAEGAQQEFLSRLLLVLGSFVVLCLVLF